MTRRSELDPSTAALARGAYYELSRGIGGGVVAAGFTDLRPAHGNVLEQLGHEDGLRVSQLAERTSMTAQSMGELVDDLETLGYVERRPDPTDRRTKPVYLTSRGTASVAASSRAVVEQERDIEGRLGSARYRELRETLGILQDLGIEAAIWREKPTVVRD
jgi:DNA-binding MarR family transcriptional regulator